MSYDCYCDYDPPEFMHSKIAKARKQHHCYECGAEIAPGEQYEYTAGKWDGYFDTYHVCARCYSLRTWVQINVPCLCWGFGNMIEDCRDAVRAAQCRAPEETRGLLFGFLRRLYAIRKARSAQ
jgi:hypothetical protein